MTAQEFLEKKQEIEWQMENLKDALRSLEKQHICESELYKQFVVGQPVMVVTPQYTAYKLPTCESVVIPQKSVKGAVKGFCINIDGVVCLEINKLNRDGLMSSKQLFYSTKTDTIVKLSNDKNKKKKEE